MILFFATFLVKAPAISLISAVETLHLALPFEEEGLGGGL
jgi:hypothetical protein